MKSKQFCSVCKQWLDMEVVSSGDAEEDDGVTWYRCPGCQGFLPKLNSAVDENVPDAPATVPSVDVPATEATENIPAERPSDEMPWDSPGDMIAEVAATSQAEVAATLADMDSPPPVAEAPTPVFIEKAEATEETSATPEVVSENETLAEYAAILDEVDPEHAVPYRPWKSYEVGECVLHLAWNDCGVVVDKESLPGGRQVIKCFFSEAGIVRLIENAPRE